MPRSLVLLLLLLPGPACATFPLCKLPPAQNGPQQVSFGIVRVPADAPLGAILARRVTSPWTPSYGYLCKKYTSTFTLGLFGGTALGEGTHATNLPGVGIRIRFHHNGEWVVLPYVRSHDHGLFKPVQLVLINAHFSVELVKTGAIVRGGNLSQGILAQAGFDNRPLVQLALLDARVEPQRPTCAFLSRQLVFDLGKVDGGVLRSEGHSRWATQQLVSTGCSNVTEMLMTFTGAADEADPSLFKLNGGDAAKGVAVEMRSDHPDTQAIPNSSVPMVLPAWSEGRSHGFRARYRTTGGSLMPGSANTSITVNVTYR
ncbi:fimbrial protein [Luteibacter yeojuensis]|uniref:Fimbrial protein n=1 Tax=Luteibacter yeojuensis TaxID=345309 RepID=A0A7X5QWI9_9GAMM|nr:fimbrial protein [Luteibacter yeojuensis]NID16691.1 fimbrial protein [Luteibacter yeojuensis]